MIYSQTYMEKGAVSLPWRVQINGKMLLKAKTYPWESDAPEEFGSFDTAEVARRRAVALLEIELMQPKAKP